MDRLKYILEHLQHSNEAIPARKFAEELNVSRQVIVGDIALLRAKGNQIISTHRGYLMHQKKSGIIKSVVVKHDESMTQKELETIIKHDIEILNVSIDHPVYGDLKGQLNIKTQNDIDSFISQEATALSSLTDGVHIHELLCPSVENYHNCLRDLQKLGILFDSLHVS